MAHVVVPSEGQAVVELLELERVAALESERQGIVVVEEITAAHVKLVGQSTSLAEAQVERVHDGRDAERALVVLAEVLLHTVHQVLAHQIPEYGFGLALPFGRARRHGRQRVVAGVDGKVYGVDRFGTHALHLLARRERVGWGDGIALGAYHRTHTAAHLVAQIAEGGDHLTGVWQQTAYSFLSHFHVELEAHHVVFAFHLTVEYSSCSIVNRGKSAYCLCVTSFWTKRYHSLVAGQQTGAVAIEMTVVAVERREQVAVDDGGAVDIGRKIL